MILATSHPLTNLKCKSIASAKTILEAMTTAVDAVVDATRVTVATVDREVVVADVAVRERARVVVVVVAVVVDAISVAPMACKMMVMILVP